MRTGPTVGTPFGLDHAGDSTAVLICMSVKPVSGVENYYAIDASDAGKVAFLLTGIEDTSPQLCYEIMKAPGRTDR